LPRDGIIEAHAVISVRLSFRPSVTFVDSVKMNKHILKIFSPPGSHAILVFPHETSWQYSNVDPLTWASNRGWVGTNRDSRRIFGYRSMTGGVRSCEQQLRRPPCNLPHRSPRISESLYITTSMDDRTARREQN